MEDKNTVSENTEQEGKTPIEEKLEKLASEGQIPEAGKEQEAREEAEKAKEGQEEDEGAKEALAKHEAEKAEKEKEQLAKKEQAFRMLQQGGYFFKYIYDDIERQKREHLNRAQRRRFEKDLRKGIFSKELIDVYVGKVDQAVDWIEKNMNGAEQTINKIATHYKTQGFENPEFLKSILEGYFKGKFVLKGEEPKDGADFYKELKEKEAKGELKDDCDKNCDCPDNEDGSKKCLKNDKK